jgi:hypothetical protein
MRDYLNYIRNLFIYFIWVLKGSPIPPHILYKRKRIKLYAKKFNCKTFIETGTADGKTLIAVKRCFNKLMSVEIYEPNYLVAIKRTSHIKKIRLYLGDSGELLGKMIDNIDDRCLFWLDGHYSGSGTGKSNLETPIIKELNYIKGHKQNDHIILIDDSRLFNGIHDYPDIKEIEKKLLEINSNYKILIEKDCIIVSP